MWSRPVCCFFVHPAFLQTTIYRKTYALLIRGLLSSGYETVSLVKTLPPIRNWLGYLGAWLVRAPGVGHPVGSGQPEFDAGINLGNCGALVTVKCDIGSQHYSAHGV